MSESEQQEMTREQEIERIMRIQREIIEAKKGEAERAVLRERETLKARALTRGHEGINQPHLATCRACAARIVDLLSLPDPKSCTLDAQ
jgi:hypothetical protein